MDAAETERYDRRMALAEDERQRDEKTRGGWLARASGKDRELREGGGGNNIDDAKGNRPEGPQ